MARGITYSEGLHIDASDLLKASIRLAKYSDEYKRVASEAILGACEVTKKEIPRAITREYDITPKSLMDQTHRAKTSIKVVKVGEVGGQVEISGNRLPSIRFNVIPTGPPTMAGIPLNRRQIVSISTVRGVVRTGLKNRFVQQMPSGHVGVYFKKDPLERAKTGNWKIDEEYMISAAEMVRGKRLREYLQNYINSSFIELFDSIMYKVKP